MLQSHCSLYAPASFCAVFVGPLVFKTLRIINVIDALAVIFVAPSSAVCCAVIVCENVVLEAISG